jgi:hypothetical protein
MQPRARKVSNPLFEACPAVPENRPHLLAFSNLVVLSILISCMAPLNTSMQDQFPELARYVHRLVGGSAL